MSWCSQNIRRRIAVLALSIGSLGVVAPSPAAADRVSDAKASVQKAQDYLEYLDEQVAILEADQLDAEQGLAEAEAAVEESQGRIAALGSQLAELRGELGDLALQTFITGDQASGAASLLTGSGTITEAVEREQYARLAMSAGQSSSDELDALLTDLDDEQQLLEQRQQAATDLVESVKTKQEARDAAEVEAEQALADSEARYGQTLQEEQARRQRELLAQQQAEQAAAAARIAAAKAPSTGGSSPTGGSTSSGGGSNSGAGSNSGSGQANEDAGTSSPTASSGNSSAGKNIPPPSPGASGAVNAAVSQVGVGYRYATAAPGDAFDCSGLTYWAWSRSGVTLPRNSRAQYAATNHVPASEAQPGDLIFFYNPISHVGLYVGGGMMVDAANPKSGVRHTAVNWGKVVGVGRPG